MTHGFSDQSGKPIKTTKLKDRVINYDTRTDEITVEYEDEFRSYDVDDREVKITRYGEPIKLDGIVYPNWEDLRGELE